MNHSHHFLSLALLLVSLAAMASGNETVTFPSEEGLLITADIHNGIFRLVSNYSSGPNKKGQRFRPFSVLQNAMPTL